MAQSKQLDSILSKVTTATPVPQTVKPAPAKTPPAEVVPMPKAETAPEKPAAKVKPKAEPQKSVQAYVPASIDRALRVRAAEEGTTTRNLLLQGLKAIGFDVPEEELRDKRSRA